MLSRLFCRTILCGGRPDSRLRTTTMEPWPEPEGNSYSLSPSGEFVGSDIEFEAMISDFEAGRPVVLRPITLPVLAGGGPPDEAPVRLGYAEIELHRTECLNDPRPRVNVAFLAQGEPVMYPLAFDSGSDISYTLSAAARTATGGGAPTTSHITTTTTTTTESPRRSSLLRDRKIAAERARRRLARREDAYVYDDAANRETAGPETMTHGTLELHQTVASGRRVREMVELVGSRDTFSHLIEVHLTNTTGAASTGIGIFGAARSSHFAKAARSFTYRPATIAGGAGMLLIGERNEAVITMKCERRSIQWFPNMLDVSYMHWTVNGSTTFDGETDSVKWMIDTGASDLYLPQAAYDRLNATFQALGYTMAITPGHYPVIHECTGWKTRFPSFNITFGSLGGAHDALTITITPEDYILSPAREMGFCSLRISNGPLANMPGVRLIGMVTLNKLVSVFDREHDRMGFCKIAH